MKSKFTNIQPEVLSESVINSFRSNNQPDAHLIFQPRQQRVLTPITIISHSVSVKEDKRKSITLILFSMVSFAFLVLAFQDIPLFFQANCDSKTNFSMGSLISITLVMLGSSIYLVGLKQMFFLYFLLDSVLLSWIISMIGLIGMLNVFQPRAPFFAETLKYLGPISSFCTAGAYRILIKHANFKRWQNILFKISIIADGMCYFNLGVYILYTNRKVSLGMDPSMDILYKDFSLLFVFGGLSFFKQLVNLHNRFDRTFKLNYNYKLTDQIEDQIDIYDNNNDLQDKIQQNNKQIQRQKFANIHVADNMMENQYLNNLSEQKQDVTQSNVKNQIFIQN